MKKLVFILYVFTSVALFANTKNFFKAIEENNIQQVQKYINDYKGIVNKKDKKGRTPLAVAVYYNNLRIVKLLLENGANVNEKIKIIDNGVIDEINYLSLAILNNNFEMVKLLLSYGANANDVHKVEERGIKQEFPIIFYAIDNNNIAILKLLLEHGANPNKKIIYGETSADISYPLFGALTKNNPEMVRVLLEHGADVNINNFGVSPLIYSAILGDLNIFNLLIKYGADINQTSLFPVTETDITILGFLVSIINEVNPSNPNATEYIKRMKKAYKEYSNLDIKVSVDIYKSMITILVKNGVDVNKPFIDPNDGKRYTPIKFAREKNMYDILEILENK